MSWQKILAQGFASVNELLEFLSLPQTAGSVKAEKIFKTRVPRGFAARMEAGNPKDPLLLQVLAVDEELHEVVGFETDPLAEEAATCQQGLLHKYQGRVLLTLTGVCAVNCRYCFRRHFPYQANNPGSEGWESVLNYIRDNPTIHEVILSGGDPLLATNVVLHRLLSQLEQIPQVKTLRIHSRIPVVLPERIDEGLLERLSASRLHKVIVIHSNHARELNDSVFNACKALREAGCHLLNQSVLLKGVNDNVESLIALSEQLFYCGVLPYYLHLLDKVQGAAHFDLPLENALTLYRQIQKKLPGYLVPRLAREEPGRENKTLLI
ncbi:EF-P beta-lysylation protein EpmB [Legionella jamestowniensis]|uniref:L-lysine 2,3-aminomutase n=1 Tax=Legionella jamestowniensis TaxID=455 RepID=A0A0W0UJ92_9GAMM|nr:EF-P beta-lysylation protein EpmB [Legionella jamestowniensis]KTD07955.1 lysine 2,3-aminomutase [Legionella jamestowniensis]SFL64601.1 L-lysine 2,3-aminomutase [Legionella jamestowniensis DSM 19215]